MSTERISSLVEALAAARRAEAARKAELADVEEQLNAMAIMQAIARAKANVHDANTGVKALEAEVRAEAANVYAATGDKEPVAGIKIKLMTGLRYDAEAVRTWAFEHLPQALDLNVKLFEKHAKAVVKTDPVPGVEVTETPQVTIASDLSGYLE